MAVPAIIFVGCFVGGVWAASRWLPGLARDPIGNVAFFATCGLLGAGLGVVGLHIYETARALELISGSGPYTDNADILANGLLQILLDGGTVLGLATIAYLLAPAEEEQPAPGAIDAPGE